MTSEEMNVRDALSENFPNAITALNDLHHLGGEGYVRWFIGDKKIELDGSFTAMEIAAIAWWMMNKGGQHNDDAVPA